MATSTVVDSEVDSETTRTDPPSRVIIVVALDTSGANVGIYMVMVVTLATISTVTTSEATVEATSATAEVVATTMVAIAIMAITNNSRAMTNLLATLQKTRFYAIVDVYS